jgi:uncharacterized protein
VGNPFVHVELNTDQVDKAKAFYGELFDWKLQQAPEMDYTMIDVGEGTGGGIFNTTGMPVPPGWFAYVGVDDVDAYTEKAKSLGAEVMAGPKQVGEMGKLTIFKDPVGAVFAIWQGGCTEKK